MSVDTNNQKSVVENLEAALRPLNIWWFSHYTSTPDQQYSTQFDLAKRLVQKGHKVTFFGAGYSHYQFKEIRLAPGEKSKEEYVDGVRYIWLKTRPYRANDWRRALNILGYAWRAYRYGKRLKETPDVVIGTHFPPSRLARGLRRRQIEIRSLCFRGQRPLAAHHDRIWPHLAQ